MKEKASRRKPPQSIQHARELRKPLSPPETKLWSRLRNNQLGLKFRRQHPIGPYVADFYCAACKLVIELDGDSHADQREHDALRSAYLNAQGYGVVRFANRDVVNNLDGVLQVVLAECAARIDHTCEEADGEKRFY